MKLVSFGIQNFRNIEKLYLNNQSPAVLFFGGNGEGKTNILEAIYCLFRGRSFRTYSNKADWPRRHKASQSHQVELRAEIQNSYGFTSQVHFLLNEKGRWENRMDGKKVSPKLLRERIPLVVFSPEDHAIIREGPEARRRYMDELFSDICPGYIEVQEKFEKALSHRNELLKKIQNGISVKKEERAAWEQVFVDTALHFWGLRWEMWPFFQNRILELNEKLFSGWDEKISVKYQIDKSLLKEPPAKPIFKAVLEKSYEADVATGWTHHGPHRDDLQILIGELESRGKASQGQARMLAFALKWLQAHWIFDEQKEAPIFLVDDFSSEFDATNRKRLMRLVNSLGSQVFLTGTDASLVDWEANIEYTQYRVSRGDLLSN